MNQMYWWHLLAIIARLQQEAVEFISWCMKPLIYAPARDGEVIDWSVPVPSREKL